jgi:RNA polymerase sigma-70 factor (ECF subfamily)
VEDSDKILIRRVRSGEVEVFREIVERHQARIFYLGMRFFRNLHDAEDFAQEVFLKVYKKLGMFRGEASFGSWLYRLAFNLAINEYKMQKRRYLETELEEGDLEDDRPSPDFYLVRAEELAELRRVLMELPDRYNLVLKMHYFDGLTYQEIADVTGIPSNTIKSHVHRAKALIKRKLEARESSVSKEMADALPR